jgi:hypothetical protein
MCAFVILSEPIGARNDEIDVSRSACRGMTIRKVLRASAAISTAFPPVLIDAEIDGKKFQEMPVYRGAIVRLFLDPRSVDISTSGVHVLAVHGRRI